MGLEPVLRWASSWGGTLLTKALRLSRLSWAQPPRLSRPPLGPFYAKTSRQTVAQPASNAKPNRWLQFCLHNCKTTCWEVQHAHLLWTHPAHLGDPCKKFIIHHLRPYLHFFTTIHIDKKLFTQHPSSFILTITPWGCDYFSTWQLRNWDSERLQCLPKATQQVSGRARLLLQGFWPESRDQSYLVRCHILS